MKIQSLEDLKTISKKISGSIYHPNTVKVNIGMASCGIAAGAEAAFKKAAEAFAEDDTISICQTGCIGFCEQEPLVEILAEGKPRVIYQNITEDKIIDAIEDYRQGLFEKKKWILGQMRKPLSVMEEDSEDPAAGASFSGGGVDNRAGGRVGV